MPFIPTTAVSTGAAGNFTRLSDQLLNADAASIDFTGISSSYISLQIRAQIRSAKSATSDTLLMRFNGDSGSNYDTQNGGTAGGAGYATSNSAATSFNFVASCPGNTATAGLASVLTIDIVNYALTTFRKQFISTFGAARASDSDTIEGTSGGDWRSTAAVTQVTLLFAADNILAGSRATLYGIS